MIAVDLFAGAGGWTEGAELAGVRVAAAVDHWQTAVDSHAANHPRTIHRCQDLALMNPAELPDHDLLLASPACTGHTRARGKERSYHDASRATAWCVIDVAEARRPPTVIVENVTDFRRWELYPLWLEALRKLGYVVTENVLDAADFGVPQNRVRLFVVARQAGAVYVRAPRLEHVPASSFVDFSGGKWSPIRKPGRAAATLERIANGRKALGDRFLAPFYGNTRTGRSLDRPIGTITTHDRYAVIDGDRMRILTVDESRIAMSFPARYQLHGNRADQMKQLGNAVCPLVAKSVIEQVRAA